MVRTRVIFLLKRRVTTLFRRVYRRRKSSASYRRLIDNPRDEIRVKPISGLVKWTSRLGSKAKSLLSKKCNLIRWGSYIHVGHEHDPSAYKPVDVPKGYMAVYVGQKDGEGYFERVLVPVVYFNHPLFGDLLKESENEFGFHYQGGITIPCRISEFERIRTRIKSVHECTTRKLWKRSISCNL